MNAEANVVRLYEQAPKLVVTPEFHQFEGAVNRGTLDNPDFEGAAKAYGLERSGWKELVYNAVNPQQIYDGDDSLDVNVLMSHDIQAEREGKFGDDKRFQQMVVIGSIVTRDGYTIIGDRAPKIGMEPKPATGHGKIGAPPSGHMTYNHALVDASPFQNTIDTEFREEIGFYNVESRLLGVADVKGPGPKGLRFAVLYNVDEDAATIIENHRQARKIHEEAYTGIDGNDAAIDTRIETELARRGLPAHAWEHTNLRAINLRDNSLDELLKQTDRMNGIGLATNTMLLDAVRSGVVKYD